MRERVVITTEYITLEGFLKFSGQASTGGEAKERIQAGHVSVNGEICLLRGRKLRCGDAVKMGRWEAEVANAGGTPCAGTISEL